MNSPRMGPRDILIGWGGFVIGVALLLLAGLWWSLDVRAQSKPPVLTDREKLDYVSAQRMVDMIQPEWEKRTKARDAAGLAITKHCESAAGWIASLNPQTGEPECVEKPKDAPKDGKKK